MKSAHKPLSLAVHGRLSPQFRSDSRCAFRIPDAFTGPLAFRKPPDRPLSVASVFPVECLPATHAPLLTTHSPLTTFRINTCKSVSKQTTLTPLRINTYKKPGGGGTPAFATQATLVVCTTWRPLSPVVSVDCAYFLSPRGCTAPPNLQTFRPSEAALKTFRPSNFPTHGIIAAHGISEYPERHRSLGTSAPSSAEAPHSVNGSAPAGARARQRRTQTRNCLGRLPSRILEQRCRSLWPGSSKEF
jgi:hypothetical protein